MHILSSVIPASCPPSKASPIVQPLCSPWILLSCPAQWPLIIYKPKPQLLTLWTWYVRPSGTGPAYILALTPAILQPAPWWMTFSGPNGLVLYWLIQCTEIYQSHLLEALFLSFPAFSYLFFETLPILGRCFLCLFSWVRRFPYGSISQNIYLSVVELFTCIYLIAIIIIKLTATSSGEHRWSALCW